MSNGYIKIDRSRTPSRRGCGWGAALTTCSKCGKIMLGHNRGICSKCARALSGALPLIRYGTLPTHTSYKAALRAQAVEDRVYNLDRAEKGAAAR